MHEIQIPPPLRHPHYTQMQALLSLLLLFGFLASVLSAILVATLIKAMLGKQTRQIGAMKAVGARTEQIGALYGVTVLILVVAAAAVGAPPSVPVARGFAAAIADLLNFEIASGAIPWWVFATLGVSGVLVPVIVALPPILRSARITVREAIADYGVSQDGFGTRRLDRMLGRLSGFGRSCSLALRNSLRRRGRLAPTLGLLAAGGGMFMTALNVKAGWERYVQSVYDTRHYAVEATLNRPEPAPPLIAQIQAVPGVEAAEAWGYSDAAVAEGGEIDVTRTYPDGGHGSFAVVGVPPETKLISLPVTAGRWLRPGDTDAAVLNQMAVGMMPDVRVGDGVGLSLHGKQTRWRVVGLVEEVGSPARVYVSDAAFMRATGTVGRARLYRVATTENRADAAIIRAVDRALQDAASGVVRLVPVELLRTAMGDHILVLVQALLAMSVVFASVGGLGLASVMSLNVVDRTRELGVMRAIGATSHTVLRIVGAEALLVAVLSWFLAVAAAIPCSYAVDSLVGELAFRTPLPLVVSPVVALLWLGLVVLTAAVATAYPAWRASRLTVREALAYE